MQTDEIRLRIRGDGKGPFHSGNTALTRKNRRASLCLVIVDTESRMAHRFLLVNAVETCIFCPCKLNRQDFYAANRGQVNVMLKKQQQRASLRAVFHQDTALKRMRGAKDKLRVGL